MKEVYCANCGMKLTIERRVFPKYGRILPMVQFHICSPTFIEPDLEPLDVVPYVDKKSVQNSNDLPEAPRPFPSEPGDKRSPEHVKSTAPLSILDRLKNG